MSPASRAPLTARASGRGSLSVSGRAGVRGGSFALDGRYFLHAPLSEGLLLRELAATDARGGREVSVWLPHRSISPAFEDIEAEVGLELPGCRQVYDLGSSSAYIVGQLADHIGPRPRRTPHARAVIAGWFRAVAGIIDRNHRIGRWHGLLTCDDVAILGGKLVVTGFGFWVRTDPQDLATALAAAPDGVRELVAPEVLASAIGPAADLWALGRCTLALSSPGGAPHSLDELADRHPALADALAGLLDPDPDRRTTELRELAELVTDALEEPFAEEEGDSPRVFTTRLRPLAARRDPPEPESEVRTETLSAIDLVPANDFAETSTVAETPGSRTGRPPPAPQDLTAVDDLPPEAPTFEPATGIWTGASIAALDEDPGTVIPTPWSAPSSRPPIQVISMKEPAKRDAPAPRAAPLVPRIRPGQLPTPVRPNPEALGRIAPPRSRAPEQAPPSRWPMTILVIAVALAALLFAAALLWT